MGLHDLPADVYVDIAPLLHHVLLKLCQALDGCPGRHSAVPLPGQQLVPQLALTLHVAAAHAGAAVTQHWAAVSRAQLCSPFMAGRWLSQVVGDLLRQSASCTRQRHPARHINTA
eukprot:GHRQ01025345.1.p1 GENE.GHRQ01025345.1~~GHRQ01025345.1.p1  ORF type:complete len:115 (-),score=9.37 GHRQ01025345.1:264-608(-)